MVDDGKLRKKSRRIRKRQQIFKYNAYNCFYSYISDSITNVLGAYKNKEQAEQEVMLNKKKDEICNKFADAINIIITKCRRKK